MEVRLELDGVVYNFSRDYNGVGSWYCIQGRPPGTFGRTCRGVILYTELQQKLTTVAVKKGLATHKELSRTIRAEKEVRIRVSGSSKKKGSTLLGSFNPFASLLSSDPAPEQELIDGETVKVRKDNQEGGFFDSFFGPDEETSDEETTEELEVVEVAPLIISRKK